MVEIMLRNKFKLGKFGELTLLGKIEKEWRRYLSEVELPRDAQQECDSVQDYLSICAIMKNEGRYLAEWIEFHRLVGVERFYLYDNQSADGSAKLLRPWIEAGIVHLIPWPNFIANKNPQYLAYAHAAALTAGKTRWLACLDLDEFLFPVQENDLRVVLRSLEAASNLAVFRREFAFCDHEEPPTGPVLANYQHTRPQGAFERAKYKSIVDPARVCGVKSAHGFELADGVTLVNERLEPLRKDSKRRFEICSEKLRINHYFTKSKAEFRIKLARGNIINRTDWEEKITKVVKILDDESTQTDQTIQRFLPTLRDRLDKLSADQG